MAHEMFIARRLRLSTNGGGTTPSLKIATSAVVLAIVVMILSVAVVSGFKREISERIYALDAHMRVFNAMLGLDDNLSLVDGNQVRQAIATDPALSSHVTHAALMMEQSTILKTDNDFKGVVYRGVDNQFDWTSLAGRLVDGRVPDMSDPAAINEIVISQLLAGELQVSVGDRLFCYFIGDQVKARRATIVGIFNTDFESFDNTYIVGNIAQLQQLNGVPANMGNFVAVDVDDVSRIENLAYEMYGVLAQACYDNADNQVTYNVSHTRQTNMAFFAWLDMLDMNVVVILVLMMVVSAFTLVSALLMIVLERIGTIGLFKALGATNGSIRRIFILLTNKLILRSLVIGNVLAIGLALLQQQLHVVPLDAASYYMPYVPIALDWRWLLAVNVIFVVLSYLTLLWPSYVISRISPTSTMRYE